MHKSGFVIALKNANKEVLRETNNNTVYLPFHSEYSILLKNNNNRKAQVTVKIDGTNVLGNSYIILHPNETCDLERFIVDGNLNSGNKFKFVPKDDSRVSDPSNVENGNIEVTFRLEKEIKPIISEINEDWRKRYRTDFPYVNWSFSTCDFSRIGPQTYSNEYLSSNDMMYCSTSFMTPSQEGATIEGSKSNQSFVYGNIGELESSVTILRLKILAPVNSVTTTATTITETKHRYCTECGKRIKYNDKYCSRCGIKLVHPFLRNID